MVRPLEGKRVLVTGAASGIGRAAIDAFADAGAKTVGLDVSTPGDARHHFVRADLRNEAEIVSAVASAVEHLGGLDVLINNAGVWHETPLGTVTAEQIDLLLSVNLRGAILVAREALKALGPGGRIINTSSELAHLGRQGSSVYVATKAAMLGLTRSWARELAPHILVNAVAPGPTDTPLLGFHSMTPEQQALEMTQPLGRLGEAHEVAAAFVFLAGPGASFITGQCINVNGGAVMV